MWRIEIEHEGLNRSRIITGRDKSVVEARARQQMLTWNNMWAKQKERENKARTRQQGALSKKAKADEAGERSIDAANALNDLKNILISALDKPRADIWDTLLAIKAV